MLDACNLKGCYVSSWYEPLCVPGNSCLAGADLDVCAKETVSEASSRILRRKTRSRFHVERRERKAVQAFSAARKMGGAVFLSRLLVTLLHDATARVRAAEQ